MENEKTCSYLSSIKEVSSDSDVLSSEIETSKAIKLALKKDFEGALEAFTALKNKEMVLIIKKCIELQPLFEQFLNGEITLSKYKQSSRKYADEVKEIVHYKYPDLQFIELRNLERKFREKIEGIIDDLLSKNTLDSLIEAKKVYEKNIGIIKKPYNFDRLFLKTISFIPFSQYESLYDIEWDNVDTLINNFLLQQSESFIRAEIIIKEIKVIDKNRDTVRSIIRKYNKYLDRKLRQNYRENRLKFFVKEYNKHSFYLLDKHSKVITMIDPFFLQRKIYSVFYLNENCELFLGLIRANIECLSVIPRENQKAFYGAIIRSVKKTKDFAIFECLPEEIINSQSFIDVIQNMLEEDEVTIRLIVEYLKGKNNQELMESLFLNVFKKELTFQDTKKAPEFNKENGELLTEKFKENDYVIHKLKVRKILFKTLAAFELILSAVVALTLVGISIYFFRKELYWLAVVLLLVGLVLGVYIFVHLEEVITLNREKRLLKANKTINELEIENNIILKKVYLGID